MALPSSTEPRPSATRPSFLVLSAAGLVVAGVLAVVFAFLTQAPPQDSELERARESLRQGDFATAIRLSDQILAASPESHAARFVAGEAALAASQYPQALRYFQGVPEDGSDSSIDALMQCAALAMRMGRLSESESFYRSVLQRRPRHLAANRGLLGLLRMEGRNWEALPAVHQVLCQRQFTFENLAMAGPLEAVWIKAERDVPYLTYCGQVEPQDLVRQIGLLRQEILDQNNLDEVRRQLRRVVDSNPELVEAQAALGQLLLTSGAGPEFLAWHARLPESANRHPLVWLARGRWARGQGQTQAAIRCLWEAVRIYPNDRAANLLLANLLTEIGHNERAGLFQRRGEDLQRYDSLLMWGDLEEVDPQDQLARMIEILERLGRLWEARGWSQLLLAMAPGSVFAQGVIERLDPLLKPETPLTLASANPALAADYSAFPLPDLPAAADPLGAPNGDSAVSFLDVAQRSGLKFTYFVEPQGPERLVYSFDFAGGGAAALDFDQDGWTDLYLTQSCLWPPSAAARPLRNQLFRNLQGAAFEDVTEFAGGGDTNFGNGVAVGDVDGDGFPDLYVNNLGPNRLFLNNGDGTFSDGTAESGAAGNDYSLSAVFIDLNRDGLPELYVVNYLGDDAMTRQCEGGGKPIQCSPLKFEGQQDRLYLNLGDGRFRDVTEESGIRDRAGDGKGMDVIAADFDGVGGPDLFVANDTTANFLFVNKSRPGDEAVTLEEQGKLSGVAYDELGNATSSMGIAAQDVNQDGMLDLFITNFHRERNNFYEMTMQRPSLLFRESSIAANLAEPSFHTMGWGTQYLDADLDGDWDLAVSNGHLDHNSSGLEDGRLRPQFFENQGGAQFRVVPASSLGPYFEGRYFGRAMARLDWNRDGREDLAVTHRGAPAALLENTSQPRGRSVAIRLRGVGSCRDAVGAVVRIRAGGKEWSAQLTAGGGFESASHSQIVVGLGDCREIDELAVRWPDEGEQSFGQAPVDCELALIQGRRDFVVLRRFSAPLEGQE